MRILIYLFSVVSLSVIGWLIYLYVQIRFDVEPIIDYKPNLTTQFYDKRGKLVANIFQNEHRLYVPYDEIPAAIVEALVAIEDTQFFEHNGVNPDAIGRAIIKDIKARKLVEGASTLTQQLVKTLLLTPEKKFIRKIKEMLLALRLETLLTKEEILERYLNQVYFGHGYYGIKTASYGYYKKELYELNIKEIALLVGLPRAPSFYDPTKRIKFSLARANQVVSRLYTLGWINERAYQDALAYVPTIYDESLTQNKAPYIIDHALRLLQPDIPNIKYGGYTVHLTLDLKIQQLARESLQYGYNQIKQRDKNYKDNRTFTETLNGAIVTIENQTGKILALVGGVNYKESSFNRAVQSKRQPGSSIKPFLYQIALDLGYSPASLLVDISRTYRYQKNNKTKTWQPKNYEEDYKGLIPLREALVHSRNLATINLVNELGIDVVYKRLQSFGFSDIPYDLSLALGSFSISPLALSQAYTIFSNQGVQVKPYLIDSVVSHNQQKISFEKEERYITSEEQSFLTTSILTDVVQRGTGQRARVKHLDIAGKTGTTNKNIDAWFCGYTPSLQTLIWYGNDDNKPMRRSETGGRSAGTAFSYFYKHYLKQHPETKRRFKQPKEVKSSYIQGKKEFLTETSPLPTIQTNRSKENGIIF